MTGLCSGASTGARQRARDGCLTSPAGATGDDDHAAGSVGVVRVAEDVSGRGVQAPLRQEVPPDRQAVGVGRLTWTPPASSVPGHRLPHRHRPRWDELTLSLTPAGALVAPALSASRHNTDPVRDPVSGATRQSHSPCLLHRLRVLRARCHFPHRHLRPRGECRLSNHARAGVLQGLGVLVVLILWESEGREAQVLGLLAGVDGRNRVGGPEGGTTPGRAGLRHPSLAQVAAVGY